MKHSTVLAACSAMVVFSFVGLLVVLDVVELPTIRSPIIIMIMS